MSSFCFTFYRSISLSIGLMPDTVDFKRLKICFRQRDFYSAGAIYSIHSALCRLLHAIRNIVLYICIIAWKFMNIIQCINVVVRKRKVGQLKKFIGAPQRPLHSIRKTNKFIKHWIYIYQSNKFCSSSSVVRSTLQSFVCAKKHQCFAFACLRPSWSLCQKASLPSILGDVCGKSGKREYCPFVVPQNYYVSRITRLFRYTRDTQTSYLII